MEKPILIITRGLPGAGKTTWTLQSGLNFISRDAVRLELFGILRGPKEQTKESFDQEAAVSFEVYERVRRELFRGNSLVLDSMNLEQRFISVWRILALSFGCNFEVRSFPLALETLIERNELRPAESRVEAHELRRLAALYPSLVS